MDLNKIVAALKNENAVINALTNALVAVLQQMQANRPVSIRLALPLRISKTGKIMANLELANDEVLYVPILTDNDAGVSVPPPAGDTFFGASDDATKFTVTVGPIPAGLSGAGQIAAIFTPLVTTTSAPVGYAISDSSGLVKFTGMADVVTSTTPKSITLDFANEVHVPQPVPPV